MRLTDLLYLSNYQLNKRKRCFWKKEDVNQSIASQSISCILINKLGSFLLAIRWTISINGPCEGEDKKPCSLHSKHVAYGQRISLGTLVASEVLRILLLCLLLYFIIIIIIFFSDSSMWEFFCSEKQKVIEVTATHTSKSYKKLHPSTKTPIIQAHNFTSFFITSRGGGS